MISFNNYSSSSPHPHNILNIKKFQIESTMLCPKTLLVLISLTIPAQSWSSKASFPTKFLDLSYSLSTQTIFYPGQRNFSLSKDYDYDKVPGKEYAAYSFCLGEHGGTHLDAPFHFIRSGATVDKIPPESLIDVPAVVIDISHKVFKDPNEPDFNYVLSVEDLMNYESQFRNGQIPSFGVVLVYTGWSRFWPNRSKYLGQTWDQKDSDSTASSIKTTPSSPVTPTLSFPGISLDAIKWLSTERQIVGLGIDTASVDPGNSKNMEVHRYGASQGIYNLENVANLHVFLQHIQTKKKDFKADVDERDPVPMQRYAMPCIPHLMVLPIKINGGTGSPTRILGYCKTFGGS